jgi:hypothetical protein
LRGRRGTEQHTASHATGERFVMMSGAVRQTMGASDVSTLAYYRPVTLGALETAGFPQALTYTGASLKPYSPAHFKATESGGDVIFTWIRRTRIGGAWRSGSDASLGESTEEYEIDILNLTGAVIRTVTGLSSPTWTYTAAMQATDGNAGVEARVYQINTTVDRGFPASVDF